MNWITRHLLPQSRAGRAEIKALRVENATLRNRLEATRAEARYACDQRNALEQALVDMTEERDMADAYIRTLEARG